jgi:endonuclease/exonuclease/phosphatase family metal-dependent hydrolase
MIRLTPTGLRPLASSLSFVLLAGCADTSAPTTPILGDLPTAESYWSPGNGVEPLKVYTQNAYLGGDTGPLFSLDFDFGDPVKVGLILAAVNGFWAEVQGSDIPGRAAAIVDQLEEKRPHLVGLQEVVQFGILDGSFQPTGQGADMLAVIEHMIAQRQLPYEVAAVQANTSSALPMAVDPTTFQVTQYLGFTDRVAFLRRTDGSVPDLGVEQGSYQAAYDLIPTRPGALTLKRGWIRATTEHRGTPYHFIVTHLETQGLAPIQAGQTDELINGIMRGLDGVTILAGDLNSDAAHPGAPSWTPTYDAIIADGFTDAWLKYTGGNEGPGYTCCQDPGLENYPSILDERIDFVLVRDSRSRSSTAPGGMRVEIVGEEESDLTAGTGLWPADHAGLFAGLRMPKGD